MNDSKRMDGRKCHCRLNAAYVGLSKNLYYERPYTVTGGIQHTGSKGSLRVYAEIGISEHGKAGTWSGLYRKDMLLGKVNDITQLYPVESDATVPVKR